MYADSFETLQVFRPWSEDVCMLCMQIPLKLYRCLSWSEDVHIVWI